MTTAQIARGLGFNNWIEEGSANRGWYTCILTGKKFRGLEAEYLLNRQQEALELEQKKEGIQMEIKEVKAEIEQVAAAKENDPQEAIEAAIEQEREEEYLKSLEFCPDTVMLAVAAEPQNKTMEDTTYTEQLARHIAEAGKNVATLTIRCIECETPRIIKPQDKFQVTRCPECQKKHRNAMRAQRRREKRAAEKATQGNN